jgi:hypothetical protein
MRDPRIERALRQGLAPVSAPEGLWNALHRRPIANEPQRSRLDWAFWPVATVMLMLALAGILRSYTINDVHATVDLPTEAQNCHTPNFAARSILPVSSVRSTLPVSSVQSTLPVSSVRSTYPVSMERSSQEGCLACHLSMPGMLMIPLP